MFGKTEHGEAHQGSQANGQTWKINIRYEPPDGHTDNIIIIIIDICKIKQNTIMIN